MDVDGAAGLAAGPGESLHSPTVPLTLLWRSLGAAAGSVAGSGTPWVFFRQKLTILADFGD